MYAQQGGRAGQLRGGNPGGQTYTASVNMPPGGLSSTLGRGGFSSVVDERISAMMSQQQSKMTQPPTMNMFANNGAVRGPTAQEIADYARYIGMDPIVDINLLWIAEEALSASLPEGWQEHHDNGGNVFYYNSLTNVSSWEHPLDDYYRQLYLKLKKILIDNRAAFKVNDSAMMIQNAIRGNRCRRIFRRLLGKKRLDDAAKEIQAVYRGHLIRLKVREESIKQWEELERFSATRVQSTYRAHLVRRSMLKRREDWRREWRRRASVKLQSVWRGHSGRKLAREEEMYQALELDEYAVTRLQSVWRGHVGRLHNRSRKKQKAIDKIVASASKLQAVYRGHLARLLANTERELQMAEIEFEASMRIQAVTRGHWGRRLARIRLRHFLATKLQAVYRGHIGRLDVLVLLRLNSANKIQAVYRGHISRRFMVHHRQMVAVIRLHEWEHACALKLQATFRGHRGRLQGFRRIRNTRAALRLQSCYRGHLERARLRQSLAEEYAAVQLQRVYHGHTARKFFRRLRSSQNTFQAALRIQRVYRGHVGRRSLAETWVYSSAAGRIQRVFRGHLGRLATVRILLEAQGEAEAAEAVAASGTVELGPLSHQHRLASLTIQRSVSLPSVPLPSLTLALYSAVCFSPISLSHPSLSHPPPLPSRRSINPSHSHSSPLPSPLLASAPPPHPPSHERGSSWLRGSTTAREGWYDSERGVGGRRQRGGWTGVSGFCMLS